MKRRAKGQPSLIDAQALQKRPRHPGPGRSRNTGADRLPSGFQTIIDPNKHPLQPWRDLPPPTGIPPFHLSLDTVLSAAAMQTIQKSGRLVFHSVGDTGGVNTPSQIENVASYMEKDFENSDPSLNPSFFYHLGDVVYYDGESANYYPEFYEPYNTYPASIFAIPGNHDGDVNPATGESSLQAFVRNFSAQAPTHSADARDAVRDSMTQPNVYWTLETPLATIIGMYSNCPEGGQIGPPQISWLESELASAPKNLWLILAVHHPLYSAYGPHPGSQHLQGVLDSACAAAKRVPDIVLTGHVHNYQHFTGELNGQKLPCIVAGAGGYNARLHTLSNAFHTGTPPFQMAGSSGTLESFNDSEHGYLLITVTKKNLKCQYFAVPNPGVPQAGPLVPFETVTL